MGARSAGWSQFPPRAERFSRSETHQLRHVVAHGLGRTAADAEQSLVAPRARDVVLLDVASAAVKLQALVHDLGAQLPDEDLGHRNQLHGLEADRLPLDVLFVII